MIRPWLADYVSHSALFLAVTGPPQRRRGVPGIYLVDGGEITAGGNIQLPG